MCSRRRRIALRSNDSSWLRASGAGRGFLGAEGAREREAARDAGGPRSRTGETYSKQILAEEPPHRRREGRNISEKVELSATPKASPTVSATGLAADVGLGLVPRRTRPAFVQSCAPSISVANCAGTSLLGRNDERGQPQGSRIGEPPIQTGSRKRCGSPFAAKSFAGWQRSEPSAA